MDINKIKVFKVNDTDWVTGLDRESTIKWYAKETGFDVDEIELEEVTDLNDGGWGECSLGDLVDLIQNLESAEELRVRKIGGTYWYFNSFKDEIAKHYAVVKEENFKNTILFSTEY